MWYDKDTTKYLTINIGREHYSSPSGVVKTGFRRGGPMRCLLGLGVIAVLVLSATAQLPTSTLNGTVTDPQVAAVASARVSLPNQGTGVTRELSSETQGVYTSANVG